MGRREKVNLMRNQKERWEKGKYCEGYELAPDQKRGGRPLVKAI